MKWKSSIMAIAKLCIIASALLVTACASGGGGTMHFPGPKIEYSALTALRQDRPNAVFVFNNNIVAVDGKFVVPVGDPEMRYSNRLLITDSSPYPKLVDFLKKEGFLNNQDNVSLGIFLMEAGLHTFLVTYSSKGFDQQGYMRTYKSVSDQNLAVTLEAGKSYRIGGELNQPDSPLQNQLTWRVVISELEEKHWTPNVPHICPVGMAAIQGGTIRLSPPVGTVSVDKFCLDINEVTTDDYAACVRLGSCKADNLTDSDSCNYGKPQRGKHPINCVDWGQAVSFCRTFGKRLPTEAEWMWAAIGGDQSRLYPWGNSNPDTQLCWSGLSKRNETCEVGSFPKGDGRWGVKDLAGNVKEWTDSTYEKGVTSHRISLGTNWFSERLFFFRMGTGASTHDSGTGFRCAK